VARHAPLPELEAHKRSLPLDRPIWVHCAAGFRAAIAASQLSAWGLCPVLVDDSFDRSALHGLRVTDDDRARLR
jgi:rhodanese-related sulfurtransferase